MGRHRDSKRRILITIPPEMHSIIDKAAEKWPYRTRPEFVREALADFAAKHGISWKGVKA